MPGRALWQQFITPDVQVDDFLPVFHRHFHERWGHTALGATRHGHAGVVHQDIDVAEAFTRRREHAFHLFRVADICLRPMPGRLLFRSPLHRLRALRK
jgi:hypothetical protein